jgi:hypothetical protein
MSLRKEVPKDVLRTVQQASTKRKISWLVRVKAVLVVGGIGCGGGVSACVLGVFSVWEYQVAPKIRALKDRHTCAKPTNSTPLREPHAKSSPSKPRYRFRIVPRPYVEFLYHSLPEERWSGRAMQWAYEQYKENPSGFYTKHQADIDETGKEWIQEKELSRNVKRHFKEFQKNPKEFDHDHWEELYGAVDERIKDKSSCSCTPFLVFVADALLRSMWFWAKGLKARKEVDIEQWFWEGVVERISATLDLIEEEEKPEHRLGRSYMGRSQPKHHRGYEWVFSARQGPWPPWWLAQRGQRVGG